MNSIEIEDEYLFNLKTKENLKVILPKILNDLNLKRETNIKLSKINLLS